MGKDRPNSRRADTRRNAGIVTVVIRFVSRSRIVLPLLPGLAYVLRGFVIEHYGCKRHDRRSSESEKQRDLLRFAGRDGVRSGSIDG